MVDKIIFKTERGTGPAFFVTMIIAELVLGVLASIIVMWFSRQREFRADAGSAKLSSAKKMIAALQRLQAEHDPSALPKQIAASGISGASTTGLKRLFSSHPDLSERIAALQKNY
jgi:heat shock protein HtpX